MSGAARKVLYLRPRLRKDRAGQKESVLELPEMLVFYKWGHE